jgi:hypothetical protein
MLIALGGITRHEQEDLLQLATRYIDVGFEIFVAVTMKNFVFWDISPSSYFTGDTLRLRHKVQPVNAM